MNNKICKIAKGAAVALSIAFASVAGGSIAGITAYEGHELATTGKITPNQSEQVPVNELRLAVAAMIGAGAAGYALGRITAFKPS